MVRERASTAQVPRSVLALIGLAAVSLVMVLWGFASQMVPRIGARSATHRIWYYQSSTVPVGRSVADLKEYNDAHATGSVLYGGRSSTPSVSVWRSEDSPKLQELLASRRIYMADSPSDVRVLGSDGDYVQVEILSGHNLGQTAWTRREGVHDIGEPVRPQQMPNYGPTESEIRARQASQRAAPTAPSVAPSGQYGPGGYPGGR